LTADYPRPGWGVRHPEVERLVASLTPAATLDTLESWGNPAVRIRGAAYTEPAALPEDVVSSVRCIVRVGDQVVICTNRDGFSHPWPGGRREPGESLADTACREVMEETGWTVDPVSLQLLGWLHFEYLELQPEDHPFPHPDFLQYVYTARAGEGPEPRDQAWVDTEGYELGSVLMTIDEAIVALAYDPLALAFLKLLVSAT